MHLLDLKIVVSTSVISIKWTRRWTTIFNWTIMYIEMLDISKNLHSQDAIEEFHSIVDQVLPNSIRVQNLSLFVLLINRVHPTQLH